MGMTRRRRTRIDIHNLILSNVQKAQNWVNPTDNCNVPWSNIKFTDKGPRQETSNPNKDQEQQHRLVPKLERNPHGHPFKWARVYPSATATPPKPQLPEKALWHISIHPSSTVTLVRSTGKTFAPHARNSTPHAVYSRNIPRGAGRDNFRALTPFGLAVSWRSCYTRQC